MAAKHSILYVEDYPIIQQMYHDMLKSHGFDVEVANDGKEAMDKLTEQKYDAILLDLLLPGVTGVEFLRDLRSGKHKDQLVIVLSDFDKPEIVQEVKNLGVKHFWIKVENTPHLLADRLEHLFKIETDS